MPGHTSGIARRTNKYFCSKNMDDSIRRKSSSGGVFHALACNVLNEGELCSVHDSTVKWGVEHSYTETISGLAFSKKVQNMYRQHWNSITDAERFLKAGRKVLFSGTPCQLAGLRLFLRKDYGNLLLSVDVACHGVPSPAVRAYLAGLLDKIGKHGSLAMESITKIDFRGYSARVERLRILNFREKQTGTGRQCAVL